MRCTLAPPRGEPARPLPIGYSLFTTPLLLHARAVRPRRDGRGCDGYAGAIAAARGRYHPARKALVDASLGTPSGSRGPLRVP